MMQGPHKNTPWCVDVSGLFFQGLSEENAISIAAIYEYCENSRESGRSAMVYRETRKDIPERESMTLAEIRRATPRRIRKEICAQKNRLGLWRMLESHHRQRGGDE